MFRTLLVISLSSLIVPLQAAHAVTRVERVTPQYLKENPDFIQITHIDLGKQAEFDVRLRLTKPESVAMSVRFKGRDENQVDFPSDGTLANKEVRVRFVIPTKSVQNAVFSFDVGGQRPIETETEPGDNGGTVYEIELRHFVTSDAGLQTSKARSHVEQPVPRNSHTVKVTPQYLTEHPNLIRITHTPRNEQQVEVTLNLPTTQQVAVMWEFNGAHLETVDALRKVHNGPFESRSVIPWTSIRDTVFKFELLGQTPEQEVADSGGNGSTIYEVELRHFVTPLAQEAQAPAVDTLESRVALLRGKNLPPVTRNNAKCLVLLDEQRLSQSLDDERYWDALRAQFTHDDRLTVHFRISAASSRDVPVKALSVRIKKELASADAFVVCVDHETRKDGVSWEQRVLELSQMQRTLSREMKSPDGVLWAEYDPANTVSWRALTDQKKYREAAQVIEQFLAENPGFEAEEVLAAASMHFDAAQNRALDGNTPAALRHIKAARHNQPTGDGVLWKEYLDGTEAFLRNDRAALLVALKKVCAGGPVNRTNAALLDKLSVHFGETYEQAYLAWRNDAPAQ